MFTGKIEVKKRRRRGGKTWKKEHRIKADDGLAFLLKRSLFQIFAMRVLYIAQMTVEKWSMSRQRGMHNAIITNISVHRRRLLLKDLPLLEDEKKNHMKNIEFRSIPG